MELQQIKTRNGTPIILFGDIGHGTRPIFGAYLAEDEFFPITWLKNGRWNEDTEHNLDIQIT